MRQIVKIIYVLALAVGTLSPNASQAFKLGLGNGSGGILNTGSGNGGLLNLNTNGGGGTSDSSGSPGAGTVTAGNNTIGLNLFSDTTAVSADPKGLNGNSANAELGLGGLLNNLFGGVTAGPPDPNDPNGPPLSGGGGGGGTLVASLFNNDGLACFTPNPKQLNTLLSRHIYSGNWASGVSSMKIVKVPMCDAAVRKISSAIAPNPNIQHLQDSLDTSSWVMRKLAASGYSSDRVIAADRSGATLVVYVI